MKGRALKARDVNAIVRALQNPANSYPAIADKFGLSIHSVRRIANVNGFCATGRARGPGAFFKHRPSVGALV